MPADEQPASGRNRGRVEDRRVRAVRGTILNSGFLVALTALGIIRTIVVARALPVVDYGVWGVLSAMVGVAFYLKDLGISDKFVQQDEEDQRRAFEKAVNAETIVCVVLFGLVMVVLAVLALSYHRLAILPAGAVLGTVVLAQIYQSPTWIFYRAMDYRKQRVLQSADPIVSFVVTVTLAVLGFGYWSLVLGVVAGAWTVAALTTRASPYPVRPRLDLHGLKDYRQFSAPLLVTAVVGLVMNQLTIVLGSAVVGLAGVAALTLSFQVSNYMQQIELMVTDTLYPAVCAIKDRADVMRESFVKSNRLGLMWAIPAAVGAALFLPDIVTFVIGVKWRYAQTFLQIMALTAGLNVVGYSWTAYYRAIAETRALARTSLLAAAVYVTVAVPAGLIIGLEGFALAFAVMTIFNVYVRSRYLRRLFEGFTVSLHLARSLIPVVPGSAIVILARQLEHGPRSAVVALAEVAAFVVATALSVFVVERSLIREILGYVAARRPGAVATAV